jgi:hypothetical protein
MANAPNTGSTLTVAGSAVNKTSTAISTNIIIMVNDRAVGAIQSMAIKEARAIKQIDEVGTDGHIDSVPHQSTNITGTCQRVRFDRLRITEAFSRGFVHAASQVYPFDIVILDKQKAATGNQISTVIKQVWISGLDYTYASNDWVITDIMTWEAERIFSVLNNGSNNPVSQGGEIGVQHMGAGLNGIVTINSGNGIVNIEQLADTGSNGQGGSLDASGLIDIGAAGNLF